jgi:hypothetical protein
MRPSALAFELMKFTILPFAVLMPSQLVNAAEPITVTLAQCQVGMPLGEEVPFSVKPMGHEVGVKLSFLVRGENLVGFKDDSVEIAKFTLTDGREWARTRTGRPNWKQESLARVDEEGKVGSFAVQFPGNVFGAVEGATLEGTIVVITASNREEKEVELVQSEKSPIEVGPFNVSTGSGGGLFGGGNHQTAIRVVGNHEAIIEVVATADGKPLDSRGSSWSGNQRTYHFDKSEAEKLKVTLRYWTDLTEQKVAFAMPPATVEPSGIGQ